MEGLAQVAPTNSGAIDAKIVVATYKFLAVDESAFDRDGFEKALVTCGFSARFVRTSGSPII